MTTAIDRTFWEQQHEKKDSNWLTGTGFDHLLKQYNITSDFLKQKKILEIGVGFGHCSREFQKHASEFYCADISQTALDRVRPFAAQTFLSPNLNQAPPVDLAICHLVMVHCTDAEVERIINNINLTANGVLMFQVSKLASPITNTQLREQLIDNGSHFFRDENTVKDIVDRTNKQIVSITDPITPGHYHRDLNQQWFYVCVKNQE